MKSQGFKNLNIPENPGVYFWKKKNKILYIGKATNLRDRVRSYFAKDLITTRGPGILDMVTQSDAITWQVTDSVLEAIILEANLIKKHQPKYNVKEKSDKSFYQVIITDEVWPRVMIARSRDLKIMELTGRISRLKFEGKIKYAFGPFPSGTLLRESLKIIRKIFPFIDHNSYKQDQQEFYKQLGLMPQDITSTHTGARKDYIKNIKNIKLFFEGKKQKILEMLKKQMNDYAKAHHFEEAALVKKKVFALEHINDISLIRSDDAVDQEEKIRIEAYDIAHMSGQNTVGVMTVVTDGRSDKTEYRKFIIKSGKGNDDYKNIAEIVQRRFGHSEWRMPDIIVIDGGIGHYNTIASLLKTLGIQGELVSVIKDDKHKPKAFHGKESIIKKYKKLILLANSESHRFAITYHQQKRSKQFLKGK